MLLLGKHLTKKPIHHCKGESLNLAMKVMKIAFPGKATIMPKGLMWCECTWIILYVWTNRSIYSSWRVWIHLWTMKLMLEIFCCCHMAHEISMYWVFFMLLSKRSCNCYTLQAGPRFTRCKHFKRNHLYWNNWCPFTKYNGNWIERSKILCGGCKRL